MNYKHFIILVLFLPLIGSAQVGDDGWNTIERTAFDSIIEVARVSIRLKPGFSTSGESSFKAFINPDLPLNGGQAVEDGDFNLNYVRTFVPTKDNRSTLVPTHNSIAFDEWQENIVYIDGLGRKLQEVAVKASPALTDVIKHFEYDNLGRQEKEYNPYAIMQDGTNGPGGYRTEPVDELVSFHGFYHPGDQNNAYVTTTFEKSNLNRVKQQQPPGAEWSTRNALPVEYEYSTQLTSGEVYVLKIQNDSILKKNGYYANSTLNKTTVTDENGNVSVEYKDVTGNLVLKKINTGTEWLKTYYAYDEFGLLRYVIPPEAYSDLETGGSYDAFQFDADWLLDYCYYYQYDEKDRLAIKRLPGAEPVYMVYNQRDQLVLTQDGNQRQDTTWLFTKYDPFNRPVLTGKYKHTAVLDQQAMQTLVNADTVYFEDFNETELFGYSNNAFPDITSTGCEIFTTTWYDDYDFLTISEIPAGNSYAFDASQITFNYLENGQESSRTKGMITGSMTAILPNGDITLPSGLSQLYAVSYYDKYGRVAQTISDNHLGGQDVVSHQVNFTGDILLTKEQHNNGSQTVTVQHTFTYDNQKRLLSTTHQINSNDPVVLNEQAYDELDRLKRKELHCTGANKLQEVNYNYNIRGWLTNINDVSALGNDMFAMELGYTTGTNPQYNGNIASMQWNTNQFGANAYQFDYDGANRITEAVFSGTGQHNTSYSYDKNGNIETLTRQGQLGGGQSWDYIDSLTYTYQGNQLQSVNDIDDTGEPGIKFQINGFSDFGTFATTEFTYDANGNVTQDLNKSILLTEYYHLNLPKRIKIFDEFVNDILYLYDANGTKLQKATRMDYVATHTTDYCGNFVYVDGQLAYILTPEGRVVVDGATYEYQYYLKDHLGNTRVTLKEGGIIQEDSYYPFGMAMAGLSDASGQDLPNKFLYNGKELQDDFGLGWYDYGWRFYDAEIGRWHVIDPAVEDNHFEHSPYTYVYNNPTRLLDLYGLDSAQRAIAVNRMNEHIDEGSTYEWDHSATTDPNGTSPGKKGNCSSAVSDCVVKGGEDNPSDTPSDGCKGSGVLNIETNTTKVEDNKDVQSGNIITFRIEKGHEYHTGLVTNVTVTKDGKIKIAFGHLEGPKGNKAGPETFTIGDGSKWDKRTNGFYKWDTKPDKPRVNQVSKPQSNKNGKASFGKRFRNFMNKLGSSMSNQSNYTGY